MLAARVSLPLLERLRRSPFGGEWLRGARLRVDCDGEQLLAATDRVVEWSGEPTDAVIQTSGADFDRMLASVAPEARVGWVLGDREDAPARLKQARAVMALAALGWCGPWPDAEAAAELVALTRRAALDLAVGPADTVGPLFRPGAPPELASVHVRLTDGARPRHTTLGLSDTPGAPEFVTDGGPLRLRLSVLHWLEAGSVPATLAVDGEVLRFRSKPMPLPHATSALVHVSAG